MVTVEGPGSLRVTEAGVTLNLRAGRIEEAISFALVKGVRNWFDAVSKELMLRVEEARPRSTTYFGGNMSMLIRSVWSQVLSACVSQRHGGAFVVMSPDDMDGNIELKYPLEPVNLGGKVVDFWLSCVETDYKEKRDLNLWLRRQNSFRKQIDVVSSLANVDGCVCVTRDLKILGCGGEIIVSEEAAMDSHLVLVDAKTEKPREQQGSAQFGGTRHRSAYRLCKVVPNALAFVVSQDGNLGGFYSDDMYVYAFRGLGPWFTNADLE